MLGRDIQLLALSVGLGLTLIVSSAVAFVPPVGGVIHACLTTKGKAQVRGKLRVVTAPRNCKVRRGERAIAWNLTGPTGPAGISGPSGSPGSRGLAGVAGLQGLVGPEGPAGAAAGVAQGLEETINTQAAQIKALNGQVENLSSALLGVEGGLGTVQNTVANACAQLGTVSTQVNEVATAVGGITLLNALNLGGLGLSIPALPSPLDTEGCK
ncbi:MAG TPA: collagen-like protein [Solirubrobacterales bacterium]|jgi:hypothetical protein|nr:collagen-like protein [Solirubrobacterales bacterium]